LIKFGNLAIAFALVVLVTGFGMADPGIPATFETQGVSLVTSINITGNIFSSTDVTWSGSGGGIITNGLDPLLAGYPNWNNYPFPGGYNSFLTAWANFESDYPGVTLQDYTAFLQQYFPASPTTKFFTDLTSWAAQQNAGGLQGQLHDNEVRYSTTYSEETQSNGVGFINYDKDMNLETNAALNGQSNIQAVKQVQYQGYNGGTIVSTDNIFLSGTGEAQPTSGRAICVFASGTDSSIPRFCNQVEAGSSFIMEVVNARTETSDRFVTGSADTPVEVIHDIRVDSLGDSPSLGSVSAFMEGTILEGRDNTISSADAGLGHTITLSDAGKSGAFEEVSFRESTSVDGVITLFDKDMAWESGIRRTRD